MYSLTINYIIIEIKVYIIHNTLIKLSDETIQTINKIYSLSHMRTLRNMCATAQQYTMAYDTKSY